MKVLITICARGGSKRLPRKNIKLTAGKPLIVYSVEKAFSIAEILNADIILSTDDMKIKKVAANFGLKTNYSRPTSLATDNSGKIDVIKDALEFSEKQKNIKYDYLIDLDVTSPLRTTDDIISAFEMLKADSKAYNIFSVSRPYRNPYFNMTEKKENGYYDLVCKRNVFLTTQSAPEVYDLNASFYIFRRTFFEKQFNSVFSDKTLVFPVSHICFDIDNQEDFDYLEYIIEKGKFKF